MTYLIAKLGSPPKGCTVTPAHPRSLAQKNRAPRGVETGPKRRGKQRDPATQKG